MAVKLRFKRTGRRNLKCFRLGAFDSRNARDGRAIEELGSYQPTHKDPDKQVALNRERIEYWLRVGAEPSETVRALLRKQGIALKPVRAEAKA